MTRHPLLTVVCFAILGGCGGGGGGDGGEPIGPPAPPPGPTTPITPRPPVVTEPVEISFERVLKPGFTRTVDGLFAGFTDAQRFSGGLAAADYDGDGDVDLYVVGRDSQPNHFYQNQGNGTFVEIGEHLGLGVQHWGSGPSFGDYDNDGDLDLFVGAIEGDPVYLFENRLNEARGRFVNVTLEAGLVLEPRNTVSSLFFDYDGDGFLDLFLTHWGQPYLKGHDTQTVWRNNGDGTFSSVSVDCGVADGLVEGDYDWSFTPNLSDIDGDGDSDLLMTSDFGESQVFRNNSDGTFTRITDRSVIIDQSGMGSSVADFDNDGDMDWFVTSIYNIDVPRGNHFGNRMYRNLGRSQFVDATLGSNTDDGAWGWGSCAGDFDNDGFLDIVQVNGWIFALLKDYRYDPIRFFHNQATGGLIFEEKAYDAGLHNAGQGRGLACFDAERDGDLDIVIVNNGPNHIVYYRNTTETDNNYLRVILKFGDNNRFAIGSHVTLTTDQGSQVREFGSRNNYVSHDPFELHFGLGSATHADIKVRWPDGHTTTERNVAANQEITLESHEANLRLVVVSGTGGGILRPGDRVSIEAADPEPDYFFSHWSSNAGGDFDDHYSATTIFTMPGNSVAITAHYIPGVAASEDVSAARRWSEVLLQSIRNDYARPTVHARNLFHVSAAMYDAWVSVANSGSAWLLGNTQNAYECDFSRPNIDTDLEEYRVEAMSYAAYRIIRHRFRTSPGASQIMRDANALMGFFGFDPSNESTTYQRGSAAGLGNYIAHCYIEFGHGDGANEVNDYANVSYQPVNPALEPHLPGNPNIVNLNRWQPLRLEEFIDQAGNPATEQPDFLSPEWGHVWPFALEDKDLSVYQRDGFDYWVYFDPGGPPTIDGVFSDEYKWGFGLVSVWSSHLDPADSATMDISPAGVGNITSYPISSEFDSYDTFYDRENGGDGSTGYTTNPSTGEPYAEQIVPRGDYTRVLAEFWADGPDSETPPGHWFVILNEVADHPQLSRQFGGSGEELGKLEWDTKAYFTLGGAMHDSAITAWGIKGWYDYIRPISAIRGMADRGQSTHTDQDSYDVNGIELVDGYIELVDADDELAGSEAQHVGKIKLLAWRGPDFVDDPTTDVGGVDWILAENWWPYQRPSFVTPPFAGYVSGHSTYSRAAAEVLTSITGDRFFPGGMSDFEIKANEFLKFESGPSVDMTLQWATYQDASDQCSLSRIWGGIHPPADDIPGRLIGIDIGKDAFEHAKSYFDGSTASQLASAQ